MKTKSSKDVNGRYLSAGYFLCI